MEILKNSEPVVYFEVPNSLTSALFVVRKNDVQVGASAAATVSDGVAEVAIPYAATTTDGTVEVTLSFTYAANNYEQVQKYEVVTPYLTKSEIKYIVGDATDHEIEMIERAVRLIINAHCGQNFGKYIGPLNVTGGGESILRLPRRLISLNNINDNDYWSGAVNVRGGGWFLQTKTIGVPSIRADYYGYHYNPNTGVISAPPLSGVFGPFLENYEYVIDGTWGWDEVPEAVREAARLLVNDYACGDNNYRDRFLTSMTAADWRIQFHEGAFTNTGNVRANQLLSEFVLRRGWLVV